jgi:hypothetical protein
MESINKLWDIYTMEHYNSEIKKSGDIPIWINENMLYLVKNTWKERLYCMILFLWYCKVKLYGKSFLVSRGWSWERYNYKGAYENIRVMNCYLSWFGWYLYDHLRLSKLNIVHIKFTLTWVWVFLSGTLQYLSFLGLFHWHNAVKTHLCWLSWKVGFVFLLKPNNIPLYKHII